MHGDDYVAVSHKSAGYEINIYSSLTDVYV